MDDNLCLEFVDWFFRYSPIQPGWIRVLDLLNKPGDDEPLKCRLRQVKLQSPEADYNALSYVWGRDRKPFQIQVLQERWPGASTSGGTISLTKSLHHALQDLRDCDEVQPKTFWIDQICIDQSNDDEKSHQVAQIGDVFEHASRVWTYLGPRDERDEKALDLLSEIYKHFEPLMSTSDLGSLLLDEDLRFKLEAIDFYSRMAPENIPSGLVFPKDLFRGETAEVFAHIDAIISGPWTTRLWLFQENILNNNLMFLRGQRTVKPDTAELVCQLSWAGLVPDILANYAVLRIRDKRHDWHRREHSDRQDSLSRLDSLLRRIFDLLCQDPRDRIYAILRLANAKHVNIYPNYTISAVQAFTNVSVALIQELLEKGDDHPLKSLQDVNLQISLDDSYAPIPTWVPTYLDTGYYGPARTDINASQTRTREPSKRFSESISFESQPDVENGVLVVKGIRLDLTLDRCLATFPFASLKLFLTQGQLAQFLKIFEKIENHAIEADNVFGRFWEACTMDPHILNSTIDQADGKEAAAEAFHDILELLRRAQSGDCIFDKNWPDYLYLRTPNLPGGQNSAAYSFLEKSDLAVYRSLWLSTDHHICLTSQRVQKDDIAVILFGGRWIYYLRPVGDKFEYIGWGYIAGFMNGEPFVDGWEDRVETFKLI